MSTQTKLDRAERHIARLQAQVEKLTAENITLKRENADLAERALIANNLIAEFEERLAEVKDLKRKLDETIRDALAAKEMCDKEFKSQLKRISRQK